MTAGSGGVYSDRWLGLGLKLYGGRVDRSSMVCDLGFSVLDCIGWLVRIAVSVRRVCVLIAVVGRKLLDDRRSSLDPEV